MRPCFRSETNGRDIKMHKSSFGDFCETLMNATYVGEKYHNHENTELYTSTKNTICWLRFHYLQSLISFIFIWKKFSNVDNATKHVKNLKFVTARQTQKCKYQKKVDFIPKSTRVSFIYRNIIFSKKASTQTH